MPSPHNQLQITGRAGHDPDCIFLSDGTPLARLRLYHDTVNHRGEPRTTPFSLAAFGPMANAFHEGVRRGDHLFVTGRLHLRLIGEEPNLHRHPEVQVVSFYVLRNRRTYAPESSSPGQAVHDPAPADRYFTDPAAPNPLAA